MPLANNGTTCFLNPSEAKEMLSTVGFKDIEIEIITRTYKNMTQSIEYFWISAYKP